MEEDGVLCKQERFSVPYRGSELLVSAVKRLTIKVGNLGYIPGEMD